MKNHANIQSFKQKHRLLLIFFAILTVGILFPEIALAESNSYFVRGIVRDSISDEPLPYASVVVAGKKRGTVSDNRGIFEMNIPADTKALQVTCVGYAKKIVPVKRGMINMYAVYLEPAATELHELVVKNRKYSKKNNPAVDFLNRLKDRAPLTDPRRNPYYSFDKYERITIGLNDFSTDDRREMMRRFPFLAEHVDTSEVSGKPFLSLMVKEKKSRTNYRHNPEAQKEIVEGIRSAGIDEIVDQASMRVFMEDVMREIDLYQNDINLLQNRFVSPLSRIAPDFYKFYLTDTVEVAGEKCIVLSFYPHNKAAFGFNGHVYVPVNDTTMFIKRVEMTVPKDINLNFVDNLSISQDYTKAPDGSRLKQNDILTMELSIIGGKGGIYASRHTEYDNHSLEPLADDVFSGDGPTLQLEGAARRDSTYWEHARRGNIGRGESRVDELMQKLRKVPLYYWGEKVLKIMFSGYVATGNPSYFDFGPMNSVLSFNTLENVRLRAGGMTTAALSKRWFGRGFVAYGFKDHRWKYSAEAEYSFIDKEYHSREFPVQSVRLTSSYNIEHPGQDYMFTSPDNIVLSLKRFSDDRAVYRRLNKVEFNYETRSNFSINLAIANDRREAAPTMPLVNGYNEVINSITDNSVELTLRYAPGEKFFQTRTYRIPVNLDAPAITLRHTFAPRNLWGARFGINKTDVALAKRWWFSAFGYLDTYINAGHVWSRTSFLDLCTPNVNLSYIIQPQSYALMNPMEFICSSYAGWDFTYWANGAIFNYIPYLKKLKLREVFGFRGYWGELNDNNNPLKHPELLQFPLGTGVTALNHGPYMEASVGVDNLFKVLRVDYVWRLNYLNVPYKIDRCGLRVAVHVTF